MKLFIFMLSCFISISSFSQTLDDKVKDSFCECLTLAFETEESISVKCFESILSKHEVEIEAFLLKKAKEKNLKESPNFEEEAYQLGYNYLGKIFDDNQQYYFANCGKYFQKISAARTKGFGNLFKVCEPGQVEKLTKYIGEFEYNTIFIRDRGKCYLAKEQYKLAMKDFDHLIAEDATDYESLFLKAWVLEKTKRYNEASEIYFQLYNVTNESRLKISGEVTKFMGSQK